MDKTRPAPDKAGKPGWLKRDLRTRGLCIDCGEPALKSTDRAMDVNLRLATGRGLAAEYHVVTNGKWQPGDPPPTLEYLIHEGLCGPCKQRRSDAISQIEARKRERAAKLRRREEKDHDRYAERKRRGLCGRCGKRPRSTNVNTVECDVCYHRRFTRALASPHAADVTRWLKAGESQASIRKTHGISGQVVQPIAMLLRSRGELPDPAPRRSKRRTGAPAAGAAARPKPASTPAAAAPTPDKTPRPRARPDGRPTGGSAPDSRLANYRANIESVARQVREGRSTTEIAETFGVSPSTMRRWLKAAGIAVPKMEQGS